MKKKTFTTLSFILLAAVIGVMSWRDMHPSLPKETEKALPLYSYHIPSLPSVNIVPDDNVPLTLNAGSFKYTQQGKTEWVENIKPVIFAQRQVNLLFHFDNLPANPEETVSKIQSVINGWTQQGNMVSILFIDYRTKTPDLKAYSLLIKKLHDRFKNKNNLIATAPLVGDASSLEPFASSVVLFLIPLESAELTPSIVSALTKFKYGFSILLPAGTSLKDMDLKTLHQIPSLSGIDLTIDPTKPKPSTEVKIGILPKF